MFRYQRVHIWNIPGLLKVLKILDRCGKDMAAKYNLHHWDNSFVKNAVIVGLCVLKNKIWLVWAGDKAVATFQTRRKNRGLHLEKLGTDPLFSGKGAGSFCMQTLEQMARDEGCDKVCFEVYAASKHALHFYENRGYCCAGQTTTLKYTELRMEKNLE